jgi:hypothetical protein
MTVGLGVGLGVFALIAGWNFWRETKQALELSQRPKQPWDVD